MKRIRPERATPEGRARNLAHNRKYRQTEKGKAAWQRYDAKPEVYDKRRAWNRKHGRRRWLMRYGLTLEQYDAMLKEQNGRCLVCDEPATSLVIDHDHANDRVRGLLCILCNAALGLLRDSPKRAFAAAEYLLKHGAR